MSPWKVLLLDRIRSMRDTLHNSTSALREGKAIAQWLAICYIVDRYVFHLSMTHGPSMLPTLNEMGDVVVVDKLSPRMSWLRPIQRGDIVVAESSYRRDFTVCKRVIALAGDVVTTPSRRLPIRVPDGHVWLEGDNPQNSVDSRAYGPVPEALVRGRVAARLWPLPQAGWLGYPGSVPPKPTCNTTLRRAWEEDEYVVKDAQTRMERAKEEQERAEQEEAAGMLALGQFLAAADSPQPVDSDRPESLRFGPPTVTYGDQEDLGARPEVALRTEDKSEMK